MSIVSGFNVSISEVDLLAEASLAAFAGGAIPSGWNVLTPADLGVSSAYWDGNYFTNQGASAIVLQQGNQYIVGFRGTDGTSDIVHYPELLFGTYINNFQPLLSALAAYTPAGSQYYFTGASLGGGATNQMADIASSQYGGEFASAKFVAFASPNITDANGILNIGAENDPIYKVLNLYGDSSSSLDHLVLATPEYMAGNYDGLHPFDVYAHDQADLAFDTFDRLQNSIYANQMTPDSVIIVDASPGNVTDMMPGRENTGAFYLGESVGDQITGRNGGDHIEGFDGDDVLSGGSGNDYLAGGNGNDSIGGDDGADKIRGGNGADIIGGSTGNDTIKGQAGNDTINGGPGNDTLEGGPGGDWFWFTANFGSDTITDFGPEDVIDLSALGLHMSEVHHSQHGDSTVLTTPEGTITAQHVHLHGYDLIV